MHTFFRNEKTKKISSDPLAKNKSVNNGVNEQGDIQDGVKHQYEPSFKIMQL